MAESIQIVAFEGGELRPLGAEVIPGEAVLALPLSRLVVKMVRVSEGEDAVEMASKKLAALSPFPDEPLTVSCETVRETEQGRVVLAAALSEGAADDIANALDAAKINVASFPIGAIAIASAEPQEHNTFSKVWIGVEEVIFRCIQKLTKIHVYFLLLMG